MGDSCLREVQAGGQREEKNSLCGRLEDGGIEMAHAAEAGEVAIRSGTFSVVFDGERSQMGVGSQVVGNADGFEEVKDNPCMGRTWRYYLSAGCLQPHRDRGLDREGGAHNRTKIELLICGHQKALACAQKYWKEYLDAKDPDDRTVPG